MNNRRFLKLRIITVIIALTCTTLCCACDNDNVHDDKTPTSENKSYQSWMSYLSDDALFKDVILPESHNAGAVDCTFLAQADSPLDWLNCQQASIYEQLSYGVRVLDIRINQLTFFGVTPKDSLYCVHGTGTGLLLKDVIADVKRFSDEYPSEIIVITMRLYGEDGIYKADAETVSDIMNILEPQRYAFPSEYTISDKTMGELRESGKRYVISAPTEWCTVTNDTYERIGTWSSEYNSGTLEQGAALYDKLLELLDEADDSERYFPSLNRGSGDSMTKTLPLDFMKHDRALFNNFIKALCDEPRRLSVLNGLCIDYSTFDYWQCGQIILLNVKKGLVTDNSSLENDINEKLCDTLAE